MDVSVSEQSQTPCVYGCKKRLTFSTDSLKIATLLMYTVLILHTVGLVLPNWYKIVFHEITVGGESMETETYLVGLWKDCLCNYTAVETECTCETKDAFEGLLQTVQVLETIGLSGFAISTIICSLLLCLRQQDKLAKGFNLLIVMSTDACAIAGIILFERDNIGLEYKDGFNYLVSINQEDNEPINYPEARSSLTTSFILCAVAAGLCMFCIPLLLLDLCTLYSPMQDELQLIHVEHLPDEPFTIRRVNSQHTSTNPLHDPNQPLP